MISLKQKPKSLIAKQREHFIMLHEAKTSGNSTSTYPGFSYLLCISIYKLVGQLKDLLNSMIEAFFLVFLLVFRSKSLVRRAIISAEDSLLFFFFGLFLDMLLSWSTVLIPWDPRLLSIASFFTDYWQFQNENMLMRTDICCRLARLGWNDTQSVERLNRGQNWFIPNR